MDEYLVILPIAEIAPGFIYTPGEQLPLHCTLMQAFTLSPAFDPIHFNSILMTLAACEQSGPITLVSKASALFGLHDDVPVHVLERNQKLNLLHTKLLKVLFELGSEVVQLQWVGAGYQPHVTTVNGSAFLPGEIHDTNSLVLIQRDVKGVKKVRGCYPFGL